MVALDVLHAFAAAVAVVDVLTVVGDVHVEVGSAKADVCLEDVCVEVCFASFVVVAVSVGVEVVLDLLGARVVVAVVLVDLAEEPGLVVDVRIPVLAEERVGRWSPFVQLLFRTGTPL